MSLNLLSSLLILLTLALLVAGLSAAVWKQKPPAAPWLLLSLLLWLGLAAGLASKGILHPDPASPLPLGLCVALPIVVGSLLISRQKAFRELALSLPQSSLVSLHLVRLIGGLFLFLYARGQLPASFALPAGLGDVSIALSAPFVAWMAATKRPGAKQALWIWNLLGIADFVSAIALGALSSDGPQRIFFNGPPASNLALLPLSLIPTFGVPLVALIHLASLAKLRGPRPLD